MSKTVWKLLLIIGFGLLCVWQVYPPDKRLKPGIDIAGGTSMIYEVDTTGMGEYEKRQASELMIRVLQQRIDPGNQMNLIWRPQGNSRIEIQMPLASEDVRIRRREYQQLRDEIESQNISRRGVEYALMRQSGEDDDAVYQANRAERLTQLAQGSEGVQAKLSALAQAYDVLAMVREEQLEASLGELQQIQMQVEEAGLSLVAVDQLRQDWAELSDPCQAVRVNELAGDDAGKEALVRSFIKARLDARAARSTFDDASEAMSAAWKSLEMENIDVERLERFLAQGGSIRNDEVARLKAEVPGMAAKLDALVTAYDSFASRAGRLDDPEDLKRKLRGSGVLEFRILPMASDTEMNAAMIQRYKDQLQAYGPSPSKSGDQNYAWRKVRDPETFSAPGIIDEFAGEMYVLASNKDGETLLKGDGDWSLKSARINNQNGQWQVDFVLNEIGGRKFAQLTGNNLQRQLAILLDDQVFSAPRVQSRISTSGQITGSFTQQEVRDMVDKLNAGSLPARLSDQPISMNSVGATMGKENIEAGIKAGLIGLVIVAIFMVLYYRLSGLMAAIALFLNLLIIMAVMAFTRATFTMPGIAGLILTIGMAVDANVLIFERIREELKRGSSLRVAVKNGYDRAFRTILDANLTTFITALILRLEASEEVKGFALTLMIGIVTSMFTALFVTHVIFDFLLERRWLNKLSMTSMFQNVNVNWMGMRKAFWTVSIILVVGGWSIFMTRHGNRGDNSPYSIEFTGGTSVRVELSEAGADLTREDLEGLFADHDAEMEAAGNSDPALQARVQRIGKEGNKYEIVTTATNMTVVDLGLTPDEVDTAALQDRIRRQAKKYGDDRTAMGEVKVMDGKVVLETSQVSKRRVRAILAAEGVLPSDTVIDETSIQTREVVTNAIKKVLKNYLTEQINLHPEVETTVLTDRMLSERQYINPAMQGGVLLQYHFASDETESLERLKDRFTAYLLKMDRNSQNTYEIYAPNGAHVDEATPLSGVEVAVVSADVFYDPQAGGERMIQWDSFIAEETEWFTGALEEEETLPWVTQIDASIGKRSMNQAVVAIVFSLIAIIAYIWLRFGTFRFGTAAVAALVHDVSIALGLVAASSWLSRTPIGALLLIQDFKIDPPMIAGFLTVIGYSLNDTIVVFDRIRENRGRLAVLSDNVITRSINQVISRTILTSFTTLIVLVVMYIWGGTTLRGFNFVLIVGVLVGTYSSIAIAAPLLAKAKMEEPKQEEDEASAKAEPTT